MSRHAPGAVRTGLCFFLLLCVLALGAGAPAPAQPLDGLLREYGIRTFTQEDGLPVADVRGIAQVENGPLYVATGRGLVRYDGYDLEPVPLLGFASRIIDIIHASRAGRVWVVSREREVGFLEGGRFRTLGRIAALRDPNNSRLFETADGSIWLRGEHGVVRVQPHDTMRVEHLAAGLPEGDVQTVHDLPGGRVLLHTSSGAYLVKRGKVGSETSGVERLALPRGTEASGAPSSLWGHRGEVWAEWDGVVRRFCGVPLRRCEAGTDRLALDSLRLAVGESLVLPDWLGRRVQGPPIAPRLGLSDAHVPRLVLRSGMDRYWITYGTPGRLDAVLVHVRDGRARRVDFAEHLDARAIQQLHLDHEGSVWVGTERGLLQLVPHRVFALREDGGLAASFTAPVLQTPDGALWVGTWGGGLHRYVDGRLTRRLTAADGLPSNRVRSLHRAGDGSLWVGLVGGVARLQEERVVQRHALPGEVTGFAEEADGTLWFGSDRHLTAYDGASFVEHDPAFWHGKHIWAVHVDRAGALWVGSQYGLFRLSDGRRETFGRGDGLRDPFVVAIHDEPDGTLWFSTYEDGLHRYRDGRFAAVTTAEGLHHDGIWRMLRDDRGGVWMSSDVGLARVSHARLHAVADAVEAGRPVEEPLGPLVFTETEGMPSRECNRAAPGGWRLQDGRLVFNNIAGLVVVEPDRALAPPPPPRALLRSVSAQGRRVASGAEGVVELEAGTRQVAFRFAALSFVAPSQNHYRYRVEGYDDAWIDGGASPEVTYTGLSPGRYTFRVQGASGTSGWGEAATLAFAIRPFVWQTGWFRLLALGLVAAALVAAYRYRVDRLLEMQRLRLRIASDLHDDIGSNLSSIALLSEMLQGRPDLGGTEQRQLERIHAAAQETVGALREIIWLVDPKHATLPDLVRKMRRVAGDLLAGTDWAMDGDAPLPERPLDLAFMRNVYLIYKEALHNVAKHAHARHVTITVREAHGRLELVVRDDGRGFRTDEDRDGRGLGTMQQRARALGGRLRVESRPGQGTTVTLSVRMA